MQHRKKNPLTTLRSLFQWAAAVIFTLPILLILAVFGRFMSPRQVDDFLMFLASGLRAVSGVRVRVHGREKLETDQSHLFLINHTNYLDHPLLYVALGPQLRGVEAESHFKWPLYGSFLRRVGQIPIAAGNPEESRKATKMRLEKALSEGTSIVIAPEGGFTRDGSLQDFKKGAFHLAVQTQAVIVPVILKGSYEVMRKRDFYVYPGTVDIHIEDPISTAGLTEADVEDLRGQVRSIFLKYF